jgi:hypothetical protein
MASRVVTALTGGALIAVGLGSLPRPAEAKSYPVRIESQPSGATVYLDSKEGEPLGQTPFTGKVPAGSHTLIVELDGYVSQVQDITIRRHRRAQRIAVKLSKIDLAIIEVVPGKGPDGSPVEARSARILIDGRDVGTLPDTFRVPAGPHQVQVIKQGYEVFETWVETTEGEEIRVKADLVPRGGAGRPRLARSRARPRAGETRRVASTEDSPPAAEPAREARGAPDGSIDRGAGAPAARAVPFFSGGAGLEMGGRRFRPSDAQDSVLRTYNAGAVFLLRLSAEVNPLAFSSNKFASGWGLFASYGRAKPLDSSATIGEMEVAVPTVWSELDLGGRFRYRFAPDTFLGVEAAYGTHTFRFDLNAQTEELAGNVPDVKYKFARFGLEARYGLGRVGLLASGGTRLVNSIGDLGEQFAKTDILALYAGAGLAATLTDSFEARLVGHYDRYAHDYTLAEGASNLPDSSVDEFYGAMLSALFVY